MQREKRKELQAKVFVVIGKKKYILSRLPVTLGFECFGWTG